MICPNCSFDNSLGLRLCTKCSTVLLTSQSGRPTISMDGTITPAEPMQVSPVGSQIKPISVTKRVRSISAKSKLGKSPTTQAVLAIALLLVIGVVVSLLRDDGIDKTVDVTTSSSISAVTSLPIGAPINNVVSGVDILASVVQVVSECDNGDSYGGSGTIFIDEFHVLTSNHVVSSDGDCSVEELFVETINQLDMAPVRTHSAEILAVDENADLAILKITPIGVFSKTLKPVKVANTSNIGDLIIAIGFPSIGGDSVTVTRGEISGYANFEGIQWIKSSVSISGGNSGGGVFDSSGGLVGVPTMVGTAGVENATDCRPDRDTNGDGEINKDDRCVPVGGFINSLSPVKRALDLANANGLRVTP